MQLDEAECFFRLLVRNESDSSKNAVIDEHSALTLLLFLGYMEMYVTRNVLIEFRDRSMLGIFSSVWKRRVLA